MNSHSPGPWELNADIMDIESVDIDADEDGRPKAYRTSICTMSGGDREDADARLIAAAPDLAKALQLLIADFADYPAADRPCHAFDVARAALEKAGIA